MTRLLVIPVAVIALLAGCAGPAEPEAEAPTASSSAVATPTETAPPAETPSPEPTETDAPTLSTAGFGDVSLGENIPKDSGVAIYSDTACDGAGAIAPAYEIGDENDLRFVTEDRTLDTPVIAIILYTDVAATKSGVRIGDSTETLVETYGDELKPVNASDGGPEGIYEVSDDSGRVVFQVDGGEIAAIGLVENGDDPVSFLGTDAFSPCGVA